MRPDLVIRFESGIDGEPSFFSTVKPHSVKELSSERSVERFVVSGLP